MSEGSIVESSPHLCVKRLFLSGWNMMIEGYMLHPSPLLCRKGLINIQRMEDDE